MLGELLLSPEPIAYVEGSPGEQDGEFVFELVAENGADRISLYFFVMAHAIDGDDQDTTARRVH